MTSDLFQTLGAEIERLWREKNYDEKFFPAIAERALEAFELPQKVSAWDIIGWTLGADFLTEQRDLAGRFGDPPITLYNAARFHIDIYFWLDGTTAIHQHGFCGAFQVLLGSSIHSHYAFDLHEAVNTFTQLGSLNLNDCELLQVGDTRQILAGREFIHALFHLDQPSATVVVRTHRSPLHQPQFSYLKPFLAIDPFFEDPTTLKKIQSVSMILRAKHPNADQMIADLLERADFQTTFTILSTVRHLLRDNQLNRLFQVSEAENRYEKLFAIVKNRHGALAEMLPEIFAEQEKINAIVNRRAYITDAEHRFFFALLLNVEGKQRILSLVNKRFPDADPIEKILDWASELSNTKLLESNAPNALGIEGFDDFSLCILEDLLNDLSAEEIHQNMQSENQTQNAAKSLTEIASQIEKIQRSTILQPLLVDIKSQ